MPLYIFQISKKQHEIVKSMKQSGKSIQSRSLNRVLGNIDNINVQPYEVFVEEEQKKLHEHWLVCFDVNPFSFSFLLSNKRTGKSYEVSLLKIESYLYRLQLVNETLPAAYANWKEFHSQRQQVIKSLEQDLKSREEFRLEVCASMFFSLFFKLPSLYEHVCLCTFILLDIKWW